LSRLNTSRGDNVLASGMVSPRRAKCLPEAKGGTTAGPI
jgi:hypothetical protein